MDLPSLALIVGAAAFSPNPDERRAAEQSLNQVYTKFFFFWFLFLPLCLVQFLSLLF